MAVGDALRRAGIRAVLTGGACAHLYSGGVYQSLDADFVLTAPCSPEGLDRALASVGFTRARGRYVRRGVPFFVEFPRGPLGIGEDFRIRPVWRNRGSGRALVLSATDASRWNSTTFLERVPLGHVNAIEAVGTNPEATRDIWRFVFDIDWVARVKAMLLPLDHPLRMLAARPRELKFLAHDGVWVRLVDVPAALAAAKQHLQDGPQSLVTVWDAPSLFVQVTVPPGATLTVEGLKVKL